MQQIHHKWYLSNIQLVKSDLGGGLHLAGVSVEGTVCVVSLLLDGGAELHEILGYRLVGSLENVDQCTSKSLLVVGEESDGSAILASATSTTDAVNVVLDTIDCQYDSIHVTFMA